MLPGTQHSNEAMDDVVVFVLVVERGSFTQAAKHLGVPTSTVSRRITRLEDALGARLLQRTTRKLSLTEIGANYYERVARAVRTIEEANQAVNELKATPRGTLRITAPPDFGIEYLAELICAFEATYPEVTVEVDLSVRHIDLVDEGFDLAIRGGKLRDSSLIARRIGRMERRMFASTSYLEKAGTPTRLEDLANHDCVLFSREAAPRKWTLRQRTGKGRRRSTEGQEVTVSVDGPVLSNDYAFIRRAIAAGAGIGLTPWFLCAADVKAGIVRQVLPEYHGEAGEMQLVYPSARHLSAKVKAFRDFTIDWFDPPPWELACREAEAQMAAAQMAATAKSAKQAAGTQGTKARAQKARRPKG